MTLKLSTFSLASCVPGVPITNESKGSSSSHSVAQTSLTYLSPLYFSTGVEKRHLQTLRIIPPFKEALVKLLKEEDPAFLFYKIHAFVKRFLEPYMAGEMTDEARGNTSSRVPLEEQFKAKFKKELGSIPHRYAFQAYLETAIRGFYVYRAERYNHWLETLIHDPDYDHFRAVFSQSPQYVQWLKNIQQSPDTYYATLYNWLIRKSPFLRSDILTTLFALEKDFSSDPNVLERLPSAHLLEKALIYNEISDSQSKEGKMPTLFDVLLNSLEASIKIDFPSLKMTKERLMEELKHELKRVNIKRQQEKSPKQGELTSFQAVQLTLNGVSLGRYIGSTSKPASTV